MLHSPRAGYINAIKKNKKKVKGKIFQLYRLPSQSKSSHMKRGLPSSFVDTMISLSPAASVIVGKKIF